MQYEVLSMGETSVTWKWLGPSKIHRGTPMGWGVWNGRDDLSKRYPWIGGWLLNGKIGTAESPEELGHGIRQLPLKRSSRQQAVWLEKV